MQNEKPYYYLLEEWSEEMKGARDYKQTWYERMRDKGVKVKFLLDENNVIVMIIHGLAGDILQKISKYNVKLQIIGVSQNNK